MLCKCNYEQMHLFRCVAKAFVCCPIVSRTSNKLRRGLLHFWYLGPERTGFTVKPRAAVDRVARLTTSTTKLLYSFRFPFKFTFCPSRTTVLYCPVQATYFSYAALPSSIGRHLLQHSTYPSPTTTVSRCPITIFPRRLSSARA
jgi:hypothetical protein